MKINLDAKLASNIGFKDIKLGADMRALSYSKLDYLDGDDSFDADSCLKYAVNDTAVLKFNDKLNLDMIGIRTYKDKIVNIYLFFQKANGYKVLQDFIAMYGGFFTKPNEKADIYTWDSQKVSLSLMYQADVEYGVAVFTYKSLTQYIAEMKDFMIKKKKAAELKKSLAQAVSKDAITFNKP